MEKTFADCSGTSNYYVGVATKFGEKTFMDGSDTVKNARVFSLEGCLLCGICSTAFLLVFI